MSVILCLSLPIMSSKHQIHDHIVLIHQHSRKNINTHLALESGKCLNYRPTSAFCTKSCLQRSFQYEI